MAVAWGHLVLFCDVPLFGDNRTGPGSAASGWQDSLLPSQQGSPAAAGGAQAMGMSLLRSMTTAAAATASRVGGGPAEPLSPQAIKQLGLAFPVQVLRTWSTVALDASNAGHDGTDRGDDVQQLAGSGSRSPSAQAGQLPILALHWYDGDALGVVVLQGLQIRLAVVGPDLEIREQVDCFDTPPPSPYLTTTTPVPCCPEAVTGQGSRVLLLGASGTVYCSRLMGWQERLRTLQDVGKTRLALWYGLEFHKMHLARKHAAAAAGQTPASADLAASHQLAQWLLQLLAAHTHSVLQEALRAAAALHGAVDLPVQQRCCAAAWLCVCCCLVLGQQQPLFQQLFAQFQAAQKLVDDMAAAGQSHPGAAAADAAIAQQAALQLGMVRLQPLSAFLEALEPHILADRLPCLAPEVVQALVQHFAGTPASAGAQSIIHSGEDVTHRQTHRVERCVLHLDVFNLDLDQVIRLCVAHGLLSALTYVYNRIGEYRLPVVHMLACLAGFQNAGPRDAGRKSHQVVAHKLLVYLRCLFRGQAFPPGSGSLEAAAAVNALAGAGAQAQAEELRAQLLGTLLFTDSQDLSREWQQPLAQVQAVVRDPFPALQLLLAADAAATVHVLGEAVSGWDAVETELRAAAGKPTQELDSVLVATQVLVNALVTLLEPTPGQAAAKPSTTTTTSQLGSSSATRTATLDFVTSLVTARRVTVPPGFVLQLLPHILQPPPGSRVLQLPAASAHSRRSAQQHLASGLEFAQGGGSEPSQATASGAAEQLAICLLDVVGVNPVAAARQAQDRLSPQESEAAIQLLLRHGMRLAAARVHHMRGEIAQSLALHLQLPQPGAPFLYIHSCLQTGGPSARDALLAAVLASGKQLSASSPAGTAAALLALDARQQEALLQQLAGEPEARFALLRALMALSERLHRDAQSQGMIDIGEDEGDGNGHSPSSLLTPHTMGSSSMLEQDMGGGAAAAWGGAAWLHGPADAQLVELLLPAGSPLVPRKWDLRYQPAACDDYVKLACRYQPGSVLPFLLHHTAYSVHACLAAVQAAGIREAHAYLLERLGELGKALGLHLTRIKEGCRALLQVAWPSHEPLAHIMWLLALSPRARITLPQICGQHTVQLALEQYQQQQGPSHSSHDNAQQQGAQVAGGLSGSGEAGVPPMPPELRAFWAALSMAVAFCQRCSRAEKLRPALLQQQQQQQQQVTPHARSHGGTQRQEVSTLQAVEAQALEPALSLGSQPASNYWIQLLELLIQQTSATASAPAPRQAPNATAKAATATTTAAAAQSPASPLHHVFAVAVEEVVGCAAEHVQLSALVRHVSEQHGDAAVGQFRHLLAGLLSACSYEQAIMQAALRLLAHDALAQVHSRCSRHTSCVTDLELVSPDPTATPAAASTPAGTVSGRPAVAHPGQLALVGDVVRNSLIASTAATGPAQGLGSSSQRAGARGKQAYQTPVVVIESAAGGEAAAALSVLAAVGLDPVPQPGTRAAQAQHPGDFQALDQQQLRHVIRASIPLHKLLPFSKHGAAPSSRQQHAGGGGPAASTTDSFDVDHLLEWAAGGL